MSVANDAALGDGGAISFNGGTLATTGSMQTARAIRLNGDGGFDVAANTGFVVTGAVTGAGNLIKIGDGDLRLVAENGYGNSLVVSGRLIGDAQSISGNIGNSGIVVFDQVTDASFAGNISGLNGSSGTMVKQGSGNLSLGGTSSLNWSIDAGGLVTAAERFGGNAQIGALASFTFDQVGDASYAGTLSGTGTFVKAGQGKLVYDGDSASFAGTTEILAGGLIIGSQSSMSAAVLGGTFNVENSGTLGGHGTVGSGRGR
ncbi:hypothetical protein HED55_21660 [Ochrobactrum haematophilum]|uniref:Outer membrane autotransporter n=1 Tax=Brucella haematophila TaxID=419474 RepID=A0ABX1DPK7_9HYPH|nr:hypothetical protein [Brucella haematophila]